MTYKLNYCLFRERLLELFFNLWIITGLYSLWNIPFSPIPSYLSLSFGINCLDPEGLVEREFIHFNKFTVNNIFNIYTFYDKGTFQIIIKEAKYLEIKLSSFTKGWKSFSHFNFCNKWSLCWRQSCYVCRFSSSILLINHRYNLDHLVYSLNCFRSVTILNTNIKSSI